MLRHVAQIGSALRRGHRLRPDRGDPLGALRMAGGAAMAEESLVLDNRCLPLGEHRAAWYLRDRKAARRGVANSLPRLSGDR